MAGAYRPHRHGAVSVWTDWRVLAAPTAEGPNVRVLHESSELKTVLVALGAGQDLPEHRGPAACFHILDGEGTVLVDGEELAVSAGATVVVPPGATRGVRTGSAIVFLGNLGDPGSEHGPH